MKLKKYAKGLLFLVCLLAFVGIGIYIHDEKAWDADFATVSPGLSYLGENYVPQPPGNKLGEEQMPNQFVQYGDDLYYKTFVTTEYNYNKIYAYNTKTKETRFVYATKEDDDRSIYIFSTNGSKLILVYYEGDVSVVDLFTQTETNLKVQKFRDAAIHGHELIYLMENGSVWRQNLRSDKATKIEGVNAYSITVYEGVIYYEDLDNGECISRYDLRTGENVKTDELLESYFVIVDGKIQQYE